MRPAWVKQRTPWLFDSAEAPFPLPQLPEWVANMELMLMKPIEHSATELARAFHSAYPDMLAPRTFAELAKLGTSDERTEAVRVAAHLMVCELMKHFTVRNLATKQPAFNNLRELLMQWHSRLKTIHDFASAAGWNTVKVLYKLPESLSEHDNRIWRMALLLCTNDVVAVGPQVLGLLPQIIDKRDPAFPQRMADMAVSFFVEALEAQVTTAA